MGRLRRVLTMDANEAMDAVFLRTSKLFRRYPVRMHLVGVGAMAGVLLLAWREGGRRLLVAVLILWLGIFVFASVVALVQAVLQRVRSR